MFPHRTTIILLLLIIFFFLELLLITYHINEWYHKLYHFIRHYRYSFCFHFFLMHVLLFFSVLSLFFIFWNFSTVTLLQFIVLDWLLNRVNTQYSLLSFTWGWLSLNYKFIWNFESNGVLSFTCKDTQNKNK